MPKPRTTSKALSETPSTVKQNAFPVFTMVVPDSLLNSKRTNYGWEELSGKGSAKLFPRSQATAAKGSAYSYANAHGFRIRTLPQTDENGEVIKELAYFKTNAQGVRVEIPADKISESVRNDPKKLERAGYTSKMVPKNYIIVRITAPGENLEDVVEESTEE